MLLFGVVIALASLVIASDEVPDRLLAHTRVVPTGPLRQAGRMGWTVRRQLLCPACGDLLGEAMYRRFPAMLTVRATAGYEVMPRRSAAVERDLREGRLPGVPDERALRDMLIRHHADLIYELMCPRGHVTYRAAPQVVDAVRAASGQWAHLG
jgi:hypothetical protein